MTLIGAAMVALVLFWVLTDSDPASPESAIVCLPAEDSASDGGAGDTSHSVPAGSESVVVAEGRAPPDPAPLVSSVAIASVDGSSAVAVSPEGPAPLIREQSAPPLFSQNQGPWAETEYDHHTLQAPQHAWCGTSIAQCGCAMTSLGNVLSLFNVVSTPDGGQLDPGTLDAWLGRDAQLTDGGWISKGYFYGDVVWTDIATYTAQLQATNPDAVRLRFSGRGTGSVEEIRAELEAGRPVILAVPQHFIAAVGLDGDDVILQDPFYPDRTRLSQYPTRILGSRLFEPADDLSALLISAPSGVRVRVTDPQGRVLGTLSTDAPEDVWLLAEEEIPGSSFSFDAAWRDPTCTERAAGPDVGNFTLHIPTPLPGRYDVEVIDPDGEGTCVAVYKYDRDGNVTVETACGPGDKDLEFEYDPEPALSADARVLIFGEVAVGDRELLSVAVSNTGPETLQLGEVGIEAGPATFSFAVTGCESASLAPGETCRLSVVFTPRSGGDQQGALLIEHSGAGSPLRVPLTATGVPPPVLEVSGSPVQFGEVAVRESATLTLQLSNPGVGEVRVVDVTFAEPRPTEEPFSATGCRDVSLSSEGECIITITFAPTEVGDYTAVLELDHDGSNATPLLVPVSGVATPPLSLATSVASLDFPTASVGGSQTLELTLTNVSENPLNIASLTFGGGEPGAFSASGCSAVSLAPGENCVAAITFAPIAKGPHSSTLLIAHDGLSESPHTVPVSGSTPPFLGAFPLSLDFGDVAVGQSSVLNVVLTNDGGGSLSVSPAIASDGTGAYSTSGCSGVNLSPGQNCTVSVSFAPTIQGAAPAELRVTHDGVNVSPLPVTLDGTGLTSPEITSLGCTPAETQVGETVTCQPLTTGVVTSFSWSAPGASPASGTAPTFSVSWGSAGTQTVTLQVCNGSLCSLPAIQTITVESTPFLATSLANNTLDFGIQCVDNVCTPATQFFTLSNSGAGELLITSVDTVGSAFLLDADDCLSGGALGATRPSCQVNVVFLPDGAGSAAQTIVVTHSGSNSPLSISLLGQGSPPRMTIESFSATVFSCADLNQVFADISFLVSGDPAGTVELQRGQDAIFTTILVSSNIGNTVSVSDLMPDSFGWEYRIVATNSVGASVTSGSVLLDCPQTPPPGMFIEFFSATCADPNNLLVAISFLVGGDPSGSVEVQRAQEGPFTTVRVSSDIGNTVDLTDTMPDAFGWEYRIVATNSVGASVTSATVFVECPL